MTQFKENDEVYAMVKRKGRIVREDPNLTNHYLVEFNDGSTEWVNGAKLEKKMNEDLINLMKKAGLGASVVSEDTINMGDTSEDKSEAWNKGYEATINGPSVNPYGHGTQENKDWDEGATYARQELNPVDEAMSDNNEVVEEKVLMADLVKLKAAIMKLLGAKPNMDWNDLLNSPISQKFDAEAFLKAINSLEMQGYLTINHDDNPARNTYTITKLGQNYLNQGDLEEASEFDFGHKTPHRKTHQYPVADYRLLGRANARVKYTPAKAGDEPMVESAEGSEPELEKLKKILASNKISPDQIASGHIPGISDKGYVKMHKSIFGDTLSPEEAKKCIDDMISELGKGRGELKEYSGYKQYSYTEGAMGDLQVQDNKTGLTSYYRGMEAKKLMDEIKQAEMNGENVQEILQGAMDKPLNANFEGEEIDEGAKIPEGGVVIKYNREWEEYQVWYNLKNGKTDFAPSSDYQDALGTAKQIAKGGEIIDRVPASKRKMEEDWGAMFEPISYDFTDENNLIFKHEGTGKTVSVQGDDAAFVLAELEKCSDHEDEDYFLSNYAMELFNQEEPVNEVSYSDDEMDDLYKDLGFGSEEKKEKEVSENPEDLYAILIKNKEAIEQKLKSGHLSDEEEDKLGQEHENYIEQLADLSKNSMFHGHSVHEDEEIMDSPMDTPEETMQESSEEKYVFNTDRNGFVTITNKMTGKSAFLQGDDASQFLNDVDQIEDPEVFQHYLSQYNDVMESASAGSTGTSSIATVIGGLGAGFDPNGDHGVYEKKKKPSGIITR